MSARKSGNQTARTYAAATTAATIHPYASISSPWLPHDDASEPELPQDRIGHIPPAAQEVAEITGPDPERGRGGRLAPQIGDETFHLTLRVLLHTSRRLTQ